MKQDTEDTVFNHASVNVLDFCKSGGFMKTVHGDGEWTEHHTQCHHYTLKHLFFLFYVILIKLIGYLISKDIW